ncbi:MAG TPA: phosphoribosylformylglycinamidine cyclo-ligase [Verrucomicrobiales bacterium]|nr:phosphoribosylformylglycinamidine cyclo-ligase [Verrucomicrobiales bacterium]
MSEFTYKNAGVDIHEAATFVHDIGALRARTEAKRQLMQSFGLFAATYDLSGYREPVIVTGCDGVGTKLELLLHHDLLEIAGKDLVAMNVNDVLTTGCDPVMFLDYLGISHIDRSRMARLISGMVDYLESCDCILAGGETAEMPGVVPDGFIEMSGFCIGAGEKSALVQPERVAHGDVLVGYPSDGFHANGWSLVRKVLAAFPDEFSTEEIIALLAPTRLYHDVTRALQAGSVDIRAMALITGGGLPENLGRLFRPGTGARLSIPAWELGAVPKVLRHVPQEDALWTFNMGFGWVAIVPPGDADAAVRCHPDAIVLGEIIPGDGVTVEVKR